MSLTQRFQRFLRQSVDTVRFFPAESILSLFFFVFSLVLIAEKSSNEEVLGLFPLCFSAAFLLNRWFPQKKLRWIYYLVPLGIIPCLWIDLQEWIPSTSYLVALILCPLMIAVCRWKRDNRSFVVDILHYLKNGVATALLCGIAFLLVIAIYFSLEYIFPSLPLGNDQKFTLTVLSICFLLLMPIVFLTFVRLQPEEYTPHSFLDTLTNYVVTPALLIYTLILYIYFLSILFQGSLPRGGIAYLVFIFTLIAVGVKAYQPLQRKRLYDWFFDHFQWISLPALTMFWIGTGYRIHQYGYTQSRIYLILCGTIMTLTVLMFFSQKWGRYLYATLLAILLLAGFTFLPGITARELGIRSQRARIARTLEELNLPWNNGQLQPPPDSRSVDSLTGLKYETLYSCFEYLYYANDTTYLREHFGYSTYADFNAIMPDNVQFGHYINAADTSFQNYLLTGLTSIDISEFKQFHPVLYYDSDDKYYYDTRQDSLFLYAPGEKLLFSLSYTEIYQTQLRKTGLTSEQLTSCDLTKYRNEWLIYDQEDYSIIFEELAFRGSPRQLYSVSVYGLLTRE